MFPRGVLWLEVWVGSESRVVGGCCRGGFGEGGYGVRTLVGLLFLLG